MEILPYIFILLSFYTCGFAGVELDDIFSSNTSANRPMLRARGVRRNSMSTSSDPIVFPNWTNSTEEENQSEEAPKTFAKPIKIPLKFLREIAQENDVQRIFEKYVANVKIKDFKGHSVLVNSHGQPVDVGERIGQGETGVERITKHAGCEPELKTVQIPPPADPNMIQIPSCIRIEQCGGCCLSNLLSCEPTSHRMVEVQIQKLLYKSDAKLDYVGTEKIVMQAHAQCRCGCRIKPTDCSPRHIHDDDQCQCVCRNWRESALCQSQTLKIWNSANCQCECRETRDCNTGYMFDPSSCTCILIPTTKLPTTSSGRRRRRERNARYWNKH